jgi:hypothetical protein
MDTGMEAGNTNENLRGTDRDVAVALQKEKEGLPSAADLDAVAMEHEMTLATAKAFEGEWSSESHPAPDEEFVTRAEFDALLERINAFNTRSGHKI